MVEEILKIRWRKIHSSKKILAAEDSAVAREVLHKFLIKSEVEYEIYPNGGELIDRLEKVRCGYNRTCNNWYWDAWNWWVSGCFIYKNNSKYEHIPIVVNSSMTTDAVRGKMNRIGVDAFVGKRQILTLCLRLQINFLIR